jgi:lysine biosynthesis protein LysW
MAGGLERGVCPGCGSSLALSDATLGGRVDCGECGEKLEIISLHPIDLDYALEDGDWQEFEDEDWEEEEED